jgi:hypothetical protein
MTLVTLVLMMSAGGPAAVPPATGPEATTLVRADGMELIVLPVSGAHTASLRFVVRAGSANDPGGKEGLAHLLEHAVLQAHGPDGLDLLEAARAAGARLNAHTSRSATVFALDASAEVFPVLAERLLRSVTDPALQRVDLDRELDVVAREDDLRGEDQTVMDLVEWTLLRGSAPTTILGSGRSRDRVRREDLASFHRTYYAPANTSVISTGAFDAVAVQALLDRAVPIPPGQGRAQPPRAVSASPMLPVNDRIRAPFLAVVLGYALDERDRASCEPLAQLLERRLTAQLVASEQPVLRSTGVSCVDVQGTLVILALGATRTLDAPDLLESVQSVFDIAARVPASAAEQTALQLRISRERDRVRRDPVALAEEAARAAIHRPSPSGASLSSPAARAFPAEGVRRHARRAFVPERRFLILFSPFTG